MVIDDSFTANDGLLGLGSCKTMMNDGCQKSLGKCLRHPGEAVAPSMRRCVVVYLGDVVMVNMNQPTNGVSEHPDKD